MRKYVKVYLIKKFIKKKGLSKTGFCKLCGISYGAFMKIIKNDWSFRITELFKIAMVMDVEVFELLY